MSTNISPNKPVSIPAALRDESIFNAPTISILGITITNPFVGETAIDGWIQKSEIPFLREAIKELKLGTDYETMILSGELIPKDKLILLTRLLKNLLESKNQPKKNQTEIPLKELKLSGNIKGAIKEFNNPKITIRNEKLIIAGLSVDELKDFFKLSKKYNLNKDITKITEVFWQSKDPIEWLTLEIIASADKPLAEKAKADPKLKIKILLKLIRDLLKQNPELTKDKPKHPDRSKIKIIYTAPPPATKTPSAAEAAESSKIIHQLEQHPNNIGGGTGPTATVQSSVKVTIGNSIPEKTIGILDVLNLLSKFPDIDTKQVSNYVKEKNLKLSNRIDFASTFTATYILLAKLSNENTATELLHEKKLEDILKDLNVSSELFTQIYDSLGLKLSDVAPGVIQKLTDQSWLN